MTKRNGMCPICFVKQLFMKKQAVTNIYTKEPYENGVAKTPPMGWSSWNTFFRSIDEKLIFEHAEIMKNKGLLDAGYVYVNIDDCWMSSLRDENGNYQSDFVTFPSGIPDLVKKVNALGLKLGIYSSNGLLTCEDYPASLGKERQDALTFARWGVEYFKYDFCHNVPITSYAPHVYAIAYNLPCEAPKEVLCSEAKLFGLARYMTNKDITGGKYVSGLDANKGAIQFDNLQADADGEYILTIKTKKLGDYEKFLMLTVNGKDNYPVTFPQHKGTRFYVYTQVKIRLTKGANSLRMFNPIFKRADSAMFQYQHMGEMLKQATKQVAQETQTSEKPIVFSICEWGRNTPADWAATAGNLWRTTPDIRPNWLWMTMLYKHSSKLYERASVGHWNDPDMLEVGNGKLTYDENVAHFSLWCMMASPLILGNDLRKMSDEVLAIITNKALIAIDQDTLGKQAKPVKTGRTEVLARPLADGSTALCIFNRFGGRKAVTFSLKELADDSYVKLPHANSYKLTELWTNEEFSTDDLIKTNVNKHAVKVYRITAE